MAKIYPDHPLGDTKSNAERKVFYALKDLLSDDYVVLHSVPIYRRTSEKDRLASGELDFLIAHPSMGVIIIEVKGGGIAFDGKSGRWSSMAFDGSVHEIKNPYEQAKKYSFCILDELKLSPLTKRFRYPIGHAVWFPDIELSGNNLGISARLREITLDSQDLSRTPAVIPNLYSQSLGKQTSTLGKEAIDALQAHLAPSWKIRVDLSSIMSDEKTIIYDATLSQYKILSLLQRHKRALICGAAGTGKTYLAIEKSRRLASDEGKTVLFVCFNIRLAEKVRELLGNEKRVDVFHFHGLASHFCRKANIPVPQPDPLSPGENFYKFELPQTMMEALAIVNDRYDSLIVDEGQDFDYSWWAPLITTLKNPEQDIIYIFYDDNQVIYNRNLKFPVNQEPFSLHENCRNTKAILTEALKYYTGEIKPFCVGPEGNASITISAKNSADEKDAVQKEIERLIHFENLNSNEIVILTPRREENSIWKENELIAGYKLSWKRRGQGIIFCSTIHSFKGLESPLVILSETNKIQSNLKDQMFYIGISRANSFLIMVKYD